MNIFKKLKSNHSTIKVNPIEYIIVGLGNPEPKYDKTRHNAGFIAIDALCEKYNEKPTRSKFKSLCCEINISGKRCMILKPLTYMNNSGEAIAEALNFYKINPEKVLVIFDDISLEPDQLRIRRKGTHGGHNGIKSIINLTGTENFPRIKIGVGKKPHPEYNLANWVLSSFTEDEYKQIKLTSEKAVNSIELIVKGEIDKAMNNYNS